MKPQWLSITKITKFQGTGAHVLMSIPFAQHQVVLGRTKLVWAGNCHHEHQETEEEGSFGRANPSWLTSVCAEADRAELCKHH
eukprot:jgi/Astpho2/8595/Aster-05075